MPLYMYEVCYTPESIAAQVKEPHDRLEAVKPALEAMGVRIVVGGYPLGEYDVLIIIEAADDPTAASAELAVSAGGAAKSFRTTRLLNGQERIEALRKAQGSQYQPAR
jgi:uncharacterized protein with GYD domain